MSQDKAKTIDRVLVESSFTHFVVRGFGYWGKGKTIKAACEQLKKEGWRPKKDGVKRDAYWGTEDISVDGGGGVSATNMVYLGEL